MKECGDGLVNLLRPLVTRPPMWRSRWWHHFKEAGLPEHWALTRQLHVAGALRKPQQPLSFSTQPVSRNSSTQCARIVLSDLVSNRPVCGSCSCASASTAVRLCRLGTKMSVRTTAVTPGAVKLAEPPNEQISLAKQSCGDRTLATSRLG